VFKSTWGVIAYLLILCGPNFNLLIRSTFVFTCITNPTKSNTLALLQCLLEIDHLICVNVLWRFYENEFFRCTFTSISRKSPQPFNVEWRCNPCKCLATTQMTSKLWIYRTRTLSLARSRSKVRSRSNVETWCIWFACHRSSNKLRLSTEGQVQVNSAALILATADVFRSRRSVFCPGFAWAGSTHPLFDAFNADSETLHCD